MTLRFPLVLAFALSLLTNANSHAGTMQEGSLEIFRWTSRHLIEGFESQDFIVLGLKPAWERQKQQVLSTKATTKATLKEIQKEYTSEGTLAQAWKKRGIQVPEFRTVGGFNKEQFKEAFSFGDTAKSLGLLSEMIQFVGEAFEFAGKDGVSLRAVWVFGASGVFLVVGVPTVVAVSAVVATTELSWALLSSTFWVAVQGVYSLYQAAQIPLECLKLPWAVMKTVFFQGLAVGVIALLWTWEIVEGVVVGAIQLGLVTTLGIVAIGGTVGLGVGVSFKSLFYDFPRWVAGRREWRVELSEEALFDWMRESSCLPPGTPEEENHVALYAQVLGKQPVRRSWRLMRESYRQVFLSVFSREKMRRDSGFFLQGDRLMWLEQERELEIGAVDFVLAGDTLQLRVQTRAQWRHLEPVFESRMGAVRRALREFPSEESEWMLPEKLRVDLLDARLDELRRAGKVNVREELAFVLEGPSQACVFLQSLAITTRMR